MTKESYYGLKLGKNNMVMLISRMIITVLNFYCSNSVCHQDKIRAIVHNVRL